MMKKSLIPFAPLSALVLAIPFLDTPTLAQSQSSQNNAAAVCMARTANDGKEIAIILPANRKKGMRAVGFKSVPCHEAFPAASRRQAYRDAVCASASALSNDNQEMFAQRWGARPNVLCGMAEIALGRWKRREEKR